MDYYWRLLLSLLVHVSELEAERELKVELDGGALGEENVNSKLASFPMKMEFSFSHLVLPLEGVCERDVDLWPVECPVARVKLPLQPGVVQGVTQGLTRKHTNWNEIRNSFFLKKMICLAAKLGLQNKSVFTRTFV